jgi:enoyl-[acyl-carrier-protein] reductase (NADH)
MPETATMREAFEIKGWLANMTWEQFAGYLANMSHPKRVMTLDEVANMAAFAASDRASGLTGTTINLSMGSLDD